jgi:hypothetical protein
MALGLDSIVRAWFFSFVNLRPQTIDKRSNRRLVRFERFQQRIPGHGRKYFPRLLSRSMTADGALVGSLSSGGET